MKMSARYVIYWQFNKEEKQLCSPLTSFSHVTLPLHCCDDIRWSSNWHAGLAELWVRPGAKAVPVPSSAQVSSSYWLAMVTVPDFIVIYVGWFQNMLKVLEPHVSSLWTVDTLAGLTSFEYVLVLRWCIRQGIMNLPMLTTHNDLDTMGTCSNESFLSRWWRYFIHGEISRNISTLACKLNRTGHLDALCNGFVWRQGAPNLMVCLSRVYHHSAPLNGHVSHPFLYTQTKHDKATLAPEAIWKGVLISGELHEVSVAVWTVWIWTTLRSWTFGVK